MSQPLPMAAKKKKAPKPAAKKVKKPTKPVKKVAKALKVKAAPKKKPLPVKPVKKEALKKAAPLNKKAPKKVQIPEKDQTPKEKFVELKKPLKPKTPAVETIPDAEQEEKPEVVLTDADGRRYCRVKDCDQTAVVDSYCRYHYLLFWKKIQVRKKILSEGKLERYIEELTARYPDKFLDMLRKDLRSEKEFLAAIQELEIDESSVDNEFEEETQTYIEEVRGMSENAPTREEEDF